MLTGVMGDRLVSGVRVFVLVGTVLCYGFCCLRLLPVSLWAHAVLYCFVGNSSWWCAVLGEWFHAVIVFMRDMSSSAAACICCAVHVRWQSCLHFQRVCSS
jgi:hypothetical protein